jgi:outer membrane receptor protein involved in Fe transport
LKQRAKVAVTLLLFLAMPGLIFGGTVGKISGICADKETGAPLPGVAVSITGTTMGALSDAEGKYFILNVPAGRYDLRAMIIGYAPVELKNMNVSIDLTSQADFQLSSKVLDIGQTQIVIAERPMIVKDQTASLKLISREDIQQLPTRGYQDIVGLSAGVVANYKSPPTLNLRGNRESTNAPTLNIRGGRQGDVAYFVDGFSQQDPLTNLSTTTINNNAIEQISISTGGFNAEYGWVSSGAINVTTKEGTKKYSGTIEGITDGYMSKGHRYDYNHVAMNVDGPLPIGKWKDKGSFFLSMERRREGDRSPRSLANGILPHNTLSGWTWQGKLKYDVNPKNQIRLGTLGSRDAWQEFNMNYYFNQEHAPRYLDENYSYYAKWTNNLSPKTFFELGTTYYLTKRFRGDSKHWQDVIAYGRPDGNPRLDATGLFQQGDKDTTYMRIDTIGAVIDTSYYTKDEGHVYDDFLQRRSSYVGGNFALTSQINKSNLLQFGIDVQAHRLRYMNHLTPVQIDTNVLANIADTAQYYTVGFQDANGYGYRFRGYRVVDGKAVPDGTLEDVNSGPDAAKKPYTFALYLQDKIEWQGLVINAGVRYDYLNSNTDRLRDEQRPLDPDKYGLDPNATPEQIELSQKLDPGDFVKAKAEQKLSPRIGVGFPISDKSVFHVNYGKFFQRPELQYLYVNTEYLQRMVRDHPYYAPVGNPNLKPEETTAYEVGIAHQLGDYTSLDITAYYKDIKGLTEVVNQSSVPNSFAVYRNYDFGTTKGIDASLKMRRNRSISAEVNYSLAFATGTGSYATSQSNIAWTNNERPIRVSPLEFDQRHKFTAIMDVRSAGGQGPKIGNTFILENAGVNFLFTAASGTPYTPIKLVNEITMGAFSPVPVGPVNSQNGPWTYRLDLKANKTFAIAKLSFDVYVWVINVFDRKNVVEVYEGSGLADNTGWLATPEGQSFANQYVAEDGVAKYNIKQRNPMHYDTPRQVRLGLRMNF